ncbi:Trk system potassium transporter TrkA [Petroclostridium sp. X23]|uniref:Trk system potassium transporter TrkA n=1 Tax=Petroclostridium sp. X23 TaxID=3045146 RepID=UPI0024ACEC08|nr:Trk system potassium transporter TrkA [Petroclostridium sp. X23]WHH61080.1 Trk system potassium transporter TrkA [Petroclostridium sp. X23]
MRIIIIGSGKVGYKLAESLSEENNNVVIIDKDADALKKAEEELDVMCIKGNGVSTHILMEAGVEKVDLLIAVTSSDEVNMLCCLTGKKLGAGLTIARIRDPQYARELLLLKEELGLDLVINPEQAAAEEIARMLHFSSVINLESFAKGRVRMVNIKVESGMSIAGQRLRDIRNNYPTSILIGAVVRGEEVIVPDGNFKLMENDQVFVIGKPSSVYQFCKICGKSPEKIKNIMILGGGRITYYLTNLLTEIGMKVKVIEINKDRCVELSDLLPNTLVINGDGTEEQVLLSENLKNMDGFVAITGMDEENLLSSLIAKKNGVKKVITKISRTNYINLVKEIGLDSVISPKLIVTNQILKYIRGRNVESLYRFIEGHAEIVEFIANEHDHYIGVPLKSLKLPKDVIVATIVRKHEVVIPHGDDVLKKGDRVIIITKHQGISNLNELFGASKGGIQSELRNGIKKLGNIINL